MSEGDEEGRIFFSNIGRSMEVEDEIELVSVGIDIGSATSHLAFSKIVLERLDTRYMVVERTLLHQSEILLTPYLDNESIDAATLDRFVVEQYRAAGIEPDAVDTGALILTGVAARRANARAIGDLFAAETGKFVVVSAGDSLETTLAAFGSGAVARSAGGGGGILNIDIGGGTSKLALCRNGSVEAISAIDVGARVITMDAGRRVERIEEAGRHFARMAGVTLAQGEPLTQAGEQAIADLMADALLSAIGLAPPGPDPKSLYRLPPLPPVSFDTLTISGGVSEFFYADSPRGFDDIGPTLAKTLRARLGDLGIHVERPAEGIRATVIGASQYTVQVSGSTIFVAPLSALPLRNMPVIKPTFSLEEVVDPAAVADAIRAALTRLDLDGAEQLIACYYTWDGPATFARLDGFCRGVVDGLDVAGAEDPLLVLIGKGDVGGLVGIHCHRELNIERIVSIDGIELDELDFIDVGSMLEASGAVPVVVKSLVFPGQGLGGACL